MRSDHHRVDDCLKMILPLHFIAPLYNTNTAGAYAGFDMGGGCLVIIVSVRFARAHKIFNAYAHLIPGAGQHLILRSSGVEESMY